MAWYDDLNAQTHAAAQGGALQDWEQYSKLQRVKELADQRKKASEQKGNFFTNLLPTGGGIAGSLGGAAAGAAAGSVVPVIGTAVGGLLGALLGGAGGSALGKVGENVVEGESDLGKGVGEEALMGGLTSIPLGGALKLARAGGKLVTGATDAAGQLAKEAGASAVPRAATDLQARAAADAAAGAVPSVARPGVLQQAGIKLEQTGNRLLGSQANLTRAESRRIGQLPEDVLGGINKRTGLTSMDDMAAVSSRITGKDGAFSELTRNAINNTPGVDLGDLRSIGERLITDKAPLLTGSKRKSVLDQIKNSSIQAHGGSAGSLNPLADPNEALNIANTFRTMARDIKSSPTVSAGEKQLAGVYDNLAKEVEDRLYAAPGVTEGLQLARGDRAKDLLQLAGTAPNSAQSTAYKRLAEELQGIQDIPSLRTAQKPFVGLNQIDEATARANGGAGAQLGDQMQGLGKLAQRPTNMVAIPLNAATPKAGGLVAALGRTLQGGGARAADGQSLLGAAVRQGGARALTASSPVSAAGGGPVDENGLAPDDYQTLANEGIDLAGGAPNPAAPDAQSDANPFGVSKEQVGQAMVRAMMAGDSKNYGILKDLYDTISSSEATSTKVNATTQKALAQSANADTTLTQLEALLQQAGGAGGPLGGNVSSFFGGLGLNNNAKTYNDLVNGSVTQIAKALGETGAMSDADRAAYTNLLPKITDTPEVAQQKFAALRQRMAAAHQSTLQYGAGNGIEEALQAAGY